MHENAMRSIPDLQARHPRLRKLRIVRSRMR
jgi:hypothetical protein